MNGYGPFWSRNGVLFRSPNDSAVGPTEALPAIARAGYGWVAFDPRTGEWEDERRIAGDHGLNVVAWTRVRSLTDLNWLARWGPQGA